MRQNGHGAISLEEARTWIEETGLCLFLPRRQFSSSLAPSFVEAVAGQRNPAPDSRQIAAAEELLVRLETDGVAVRLNLLGQPGEQPDFVVAGWVLAYVYALRGDRDWRRSPQLTGSRQVSPLAVQAYKQLEQGDATLAELKHALGREVSEAAVLRAITELWQQLRIIPVIAAPGQPAKWQLLRHRFQKAIAEGASTSQVTAISVLASIYLQAVIAATMEEVELFLAPLTARSKVREVLRGLVATRQVHTISLGHAPHFYVAGTLPEFAPPPTTYISSAMPAYYAHLRDHEDDAIEPEPARSIYPPSPAVTVPSIAAEAHKAPESHAPRTQATHKSGSAAKPAGSRPRFNRPGPRTRDRKTGQAGSGNRSAHRAAANGAGTSRSANGSRPSAESRWNHKNGAHHGAKNGSHLGAYKSAHGAKSAHATGNGNGSRKTSATGGSRNAKPAPAWKSRDSRGHNGKQGGSSSLSPRNGSAVRNGAVVRKESRPAREKSKAAVAAGAKSTAGKRYGFVARGGQSRMRPGSKKRG